MDLTVAVNGEYLPAQLILSNDLDELDSGHPVVTILNK
jgi:hypothetical protein